MDSDQEARVVTFEVRSQCYDLSVFVNRVEGEGHTHLVLTFDPKEPH